MKTPVLACSAILAAAGIARSAAIYVNVAQTTGQNNGTSWADAYQGPLGLATAIAAAQPSDQIWVAQGQ